jgi:hypothetical protein
MEFPAVPGGQVPLGGRNSKVNLVILSTRNGKPHQVALDVTTEMPVKKD